MPIYIHKIWTILVNEKIYIFLWFWFLLLGFLTSLVFLYRILIVVSPKLRVGGHCGQLNFNIEMQAYLLYLRFRLIKKECINIIVKKTKMGDFFLLYMMGLNIDSVIFKEVVQELARKLGYHNKDIYES